VPLMRRRPLLRAAAVGGGAYAMGKRNARAEQERQDEAYDSGVQTAASVAPAVAPPAPPAPGLTADVTERLAELGKLHEQGVLTDTEFSQAKTKLLGI
jgi:hypothetical protein